MFQTKTWVEVGIWNAGEPAVLIQTGHYEDGVLIELPEILHDVLLEFPEGYDEAREDMFGLPWLEALEKLGYRKVPGAFVHYLPYSVAFDIEEV